MSSGLMSVWSFVPQVTFLLTVSQMALQHPHVIAVPWSHSCLGSPPVILVPPRGEGRLWAESWPLVTRLSLQIRLGGFQCSVSVWFFWFLMGAGLVITR